MNGRQPPDVERSRHLLAWWVGLLLGCLLLWVLVILGAVYAYELVT